MFTYTGKNQSVCMTIDKAKKGCSFSWEGGELKIIAIRASSLKLWFTVDPHESKMGEPNQKNISRKK